MNISDDARVIISTYFAWGEGTSIKIGGVGCQSVLSDRAEIAMKELIDAGYVTVNPFNDFGRMVYTGTQQCVGMKLSLKDIGRLGKWSLTKPNPELKA